MTQNSRIWLSSPHMGENERKYVEQAFDTNWIAPLGPHVDNFEKSIGDYSGIDHVAALSSGTAALHLGLILFDTKPGDYVLCQSMTFSASANPIAYMGAHPVFIDSEEDTWNMDPNALEDSIKQLRSKNKTIKAIIPVHLYGMPAKMDEIMAISNKYDIPVLEDAAEALGSTLNGKNCGSFGHLGVFSFNGNKIITTSGGGALASNNKEWIDKSRFLATQSRDQAPHYQHSEIGYNYRLSNVLAGIGIGQMEVLDDRVAARRKNYEFYSEVFADMEGISLLPETEGAFSNRWLTTALVDPDKNNGISTHDIRIHLLEDNIESRPLWKPMHMQPVFDECAFFGSGVSEDLFNKGLCLPSGSNLTDGERNRIFNQLQKLLKR